MDWEVADFDVSNKSHHPEEKSKNQKLLVLVHEDKNLERKNVCLEKKLELKNMKPTSTKEIRVSDITYIENGNRHM